MQYKTNEKIIIDKRKLDVLVRLGCPEYNLIRKIVYNDYIPTNDPLIDDNLETLTDRKTFANWGGARPGSGKKTSENKTPVQDEIQVDNQDEKQSYTEDHLLVAETIKGIEESKHSKEINKKTLNMWADEIRKLEQIDKVPISKIIEVAKWYAVHYNDNKYIPVVESGRSFREKFSKLESAMGRCSATKKSTEDSFNNISWVLAAEAEKKGSLSNETKNFVKDLFNGEN